jgi:Ca2+-transporting ATPase
LAVAQKHLPKTPHNLGSQDGYEFVGLLGFHDPPKPGAKQAVSACRRAGITVRMITGDHPQTALHIAEAIGLQHDGKVISGSEIQNLSDQDLVQRIKNAKVFARIIPEQKLRIVHALQSGGEIVGMIGDGVNDAPSLKEADVSIAMGKQGTNVAREAADMVLTDDELDTVVNAIHDGRRIYDNIQKAISYVFGIHIYIILTALIIPLLGLSPLLLPIHIILLELIIDPTCSLVFESMPAEPDVMKRPPREPERPIISAKQFVRIVAGGLAVFALTAGTYVAALRFGLTTDAARTLGFSVILWSNLFQVLGQISKEKLTIMVLGFFKNKVFLSVYLSVFTLVLALIYLPYLNTLFGFSSVPIILLALTVLIGFVPTLGNDIYKKITRAV